MPTVRDDDYDPARRAALVRALAAGLYAATYPAGSALATGDGRIHQMRGAVAINGVAANASSIIAPGDRVTTGADGYVVFSVARDAFILRRNATLELAPAATDNTLVEGLRLLTGALLSVFGSRRHHIETPFATIGIRGTGVYVEAEPEHDYVCTCYGVTDIAARDDATSRAMVDATHHTARYVLAHGASGARIREAPFKNHTDAELTLIEALVGREPPFAGSAGDYARPRRRDY